MKSADSEKDRRSAVHGGKQTRRTVEHGVVGEQIERGEGKRRGADPQKKDPPDQKKPFHSFFKGDPQYSQKAPPPAGAPQFGQKRTGFSLICRKASGTYAPGRAAV